MKDERWNVKDGRVKYEGVRWKVKDERWKDGQRIKVGGGR